MTATQWKLTTGAEMEIPHQFYVPILKSKQGEWHALRRVVASDRALTLPLIELTPPAAGAGEKLGVAIRGNLDRIIADWWAPFEDKQWPIGIDTSHFLPAHSDQVKVLSAACAYLKRFGFPVIPCVPTSMLPSLSNNAQGLDQYPELILRSPLPQGQLSVADAIKLARRNFRHADPKLHVIMDMHNVFGADANALVASLIREVQVAVNSGAASSIILAGGSFPVDLTGIPQGITQIRRIEWAVWRNLVARNGMENLLPGDYAVTNPIPQTPIDPRMVNAAAAIRYAIQDRWLLFKGSGTRTAGFGQYNGLCTLLTGDPRYGGAAFSYGDERYAYHSQPGSTSGSLWTWRRDATSRHLAATVREFANLAGLPI